MSGISKSDLKRRNRRQLLRILQIEGPTSRVDLAERIGITKGAITILANEMITQGILSEKGEQPVKGFLQFDCVDMGTVAVTNVGQTAITDVRLLHKNWLPDSEIYVGGITYETRIDRIEPGKTIFLQPEHYAYGYSKFVIWYGHK